MDYYAITKNKYCKDPGATRKMFRMQLYEKSQIQNCSITIIANVKIHVLSIAKSYRQSKKVTGKIKQMFPVRIMDALVLLLFTQGPVL